MLLDIKEFCKPHIVPEFQGTLPDVWLEHEEQKQGFSREVVTSLATLNKVGKENQANAKVFRWKESCE